MKELGEKHVKKEELEMAGKEDSSKMVDLNKEIDTPPPAQRPRSYAINRRDHMQYIAEIICNTSPRSYAIHRRDHMQ